MTKDTTEDDLFPQASLYSCHRVVLCGPIEVRTFRLSPEFLFGPQSELNRVATVQDDSGIFPVPTPEGLKPS